MAKDDRVTIRGLDPKLKKQAKADAARLGITVGQWYNEAIAEKLKRGKK